MLIARFATAMCAELPPGDNGHRLISGHLDGLVRGGGLTAKGDTKNSRPSEVRRSEED
jgi:hypothetical protein